MNTTTTSWSDGAELRLLEFVEKLIVDASKTDPSITQQDLAGWLALAVVGSSGRKGSR